MGLFRIDLFNGGANCGGEADAHARAGGGGHQAIDDRRGVIGRWEHASVFFGLRGHAARGKPFNRVAGLEAVESSEELTPAARVFLHQLGWFEAGVGDVASTTTGDADLGEQVRGRFEQGD